MRESLEIDTDGDGIANGLDDFPLDDQIGPVRVRSISVNSSGPQTAKVRFVAVSGANYRIEYSDSLLSPVWRSATVYQHSAAAAEVDIADPSPATHGQRFYRVVQIP